MPQVKVSRGGVRVVAPVRGRIKDMEWLCLT